jgi:hypothetical protein
MNTNTAQSYVSSWLAAAKPLADVPLLRLQDDGLTPVVEKGLRCSDQLLEVVAKLSNAMINDFLSASPSMEGLMYTLYSRTEDGEAQPLYVGIANSAGKKGSAPSSLWKMRGARFCDVPGSNGHVDLLSRSLSAKHPGYAPWVSLLFGPNSEAGARRSLRRPVFVHLEPWDAAAHRILPSLPKAPLYVEEAVRLWALKAAGYQLLNRSGN